MNKIVILFIAMLLPTFALAQSAEECNKKGEEYYNAEPPEYKNALKWFEKAADQGHAVAQGYLGRIYLNGLGVPKDYAKALKWLRIAAEQNVPLAQNCLGVMYYNGEGVAKDYSEALKWYRKAADQGWAHAQRNIGNMYYNGEGVAKDYSEALKWYQKAADHGLPAAQVSMGFMYEYGYGVDKDYSEALKWYQKAADQGNAGAQNNIGVMYQNGEGLAKDYTEALKWYQKAADQGHANAQNNIGAMYQYGQGVAKDYTEALKWYQKAADQGHANAQTNIGIMYEYGYGVDKSKSKAKKWYQKAADQGLARAQTRLGHIYFNERSYYGPYYSEALKWFQKAADQGNSDAQNMLGVMYENGAGVTRNYHQALDWYLKAANQGYKGAMYNIGLLYEEGKGVAKNFQTAKDWYQKALDVDPNYELAKSRMSSILSVIGGQSNNNIQSNNNNIIASTVTPQPQVNRVASEIDIDIPQVDRKNGNTFAIIIANEDYQDESKVDFAKNDGEIFKQYCHKTLGLPEKNVHLVTNATLNNIIGELDWLQKVCEAFGGDASVIFYYAGHGIPDESSGSSYLLPTDGNSRILRTCFSINELYKVLGKLPTKKITVLMDACFSGAKRDGGMLASARGVAIKAKPDQPKGNMIVISAAQGEETAYKYEEMGHGLFTYFLLKKLKDTKGDVTMGELSSYVKEQVKRYSIVENGKSQTPSVMTSGNLNSTWESSKLY